MHTILFVLVGDLWRERQQGWMELRCGLAAARSGRAKVQGLASETIPAHGARHRWYVLFPRALPIGIFVLAAAVTALSVIAIERAEAQKTEAQLHQVSSTIVSAMERRANANSAYLRAAAALFTMTGSVTADQFRTLNKQLSDDSGYRASDGMGWAARLTGAEVDGFVAAQHASGRATYAVRPKPQGPETTVVPVTYLEPDSVRNRRAIGFDMFSSDTRRLAMAEAGNTARPTATGKLYLAQEVEGTKAPGFIIYMPVFYQAGSTRAVKGYVYSPFKADEFLRASIPAELAGKVSIRIYDGQESAERLLAQLPIANGTGRSLAVPLTIANHHWILRLDLPHEFGLTNLSWLTLLFGLLVASLLLVLARLLTTQAIEDRRDLAKFEEQAAIRASLTRELNHRVKNTLANVLSIVSLTRRRAADLDSFVESLTGRIRALSATHDLLTQSDWGTTPIRAVIEAELAPYAGGGAQLVAMRGPDVELAPNDALSLGLALHELATNAAKYGSLTTVEGRVSVTWELVTPALARIEWSEAGGPPVQEVRRRGFGTDLIEKIVAHELRNPVELDFATQGVRCTLLIPVRRATQFALREGKA